MEVDAIQPFTPPSAASDVVSRPFFRSMRFLVPTIICASALLSIPIAFFAGAVIGNAEIYRNFSDHQQARIEAFLTQHPDSFDDLTVERASDGWAYPTGTVPHQADYDLLIDGLHRMFGDELGDRMIRTVEIETDP